MTTHTFNKQAITQSYMIYVRYRSEADKAYSALLKSKDHSKVPSLLKEFQLRSQQQHAYFLLYCENMRVSDEAESGFTPLFGSKKQCK